MSGLGLQQIPTQPVPGDLPTPPKAPPPGPSEPREPVTDPTDDPPPLQDPDIVDPSEPPNAPMIA